MSSASPYRPVPRPLAVLREIVRAGRLGMLKARTRASLDHGRGVVFGARAVIKSPTRVVIGDNVAIGREFYSDVDFVCGDDVLISSRVAIVGNDHRFDDPTTTVFANGRNAPATVTIGGDNLIGFGVVIVGPVTIGKGCIVGAGSVVVRDLPPDTVCVGVPARPIRDRFPSGR